MTSKSVLENVQIFCLRNIFRQIIPIINYMYKKEIFKTI